MKIKVMNKICTSIEQSKKLIKSGIDVNTADMLWTYDFTVNDINGLNVISENLKPEENDIPAWSLSALLNVVHIGDFVTLYYDYNAWHLKVDTSGNTSDNRIAYSVIYADSPIDACVEMILKLHNFDIM